MSGRPSTAKRRARNTSGLSLALRSRASRALNFGHDLPRQLDGSALLAGGVAEEVQGSQGLPVDPLGLLALAPPGVLLSLPVVRHLLRGCPQCLKVTRRALSLAEMSILAPEVQH